MKIFAIADLHLSFHENVDKPMDVFGGQWVNYTDRLKESWNKVVSKNDVVLLPGDISWALKPEEVETDLDWISELNGFKVISKGNHDYWWKSAGKIKSKYDNMFFINNNFCAISDYAICGSRGWILPETEGFTEHDMKMYKRELLRLEYSLEEAKKSGFKKIVGMIHYPPALKDGQETEFTKLFNKYNVKNVVYGHLHGVENFNKGFRGVLRDVKYNLVALDYVKCQPIEVLDIED